MRIVFMGTPHFAVPSLDILLKNGYNVVGVITAPDKPAGRGQQLMKSAVKEFAEARGLKVLQPSNLKDETFLQELKSLNADLQIVVAFRMLPESVWNMPPLGTYNVHASLLPDYRGAAPINWAIINGERETGVTTFKLKHEIDTGNILFQEKVTITDNMTAGELHDILMLTGSQLLLKSIKAIESGNYELKEQILTQGRSVKHAPKIFKEDCRINWNKTANEIHNLIRGLSPFPTAWTELHEGEKTVQYKIYRSEVIENETEHNSPVIKIESGKRLKVLCGQGIIELKEIQAPGKKRLSTEDFLRGYKFASNDIIPG